MDFFTWYWPATHLHTVQILNVYQLLRIDSSSSLRSPCQSNLMQLPSQYKQCPPFLLLQMGKNRLGSVILHFVSVIGSYKGLHIGTLTTQYFFENEWTQSKLMKAQYSLRYRPPSSRYCGNKHTVLECQIALPEHTLLCDKKRLG
jgi:hypothetical protein